MSPSESNSTSFFSGRAKASPITGNPLYEKPVVLAIYRDDHKFLLDPVRPRRGQARADYDLVIASQPYRARAPIEFKARRVVAPLARALAPGGRLIAIHSHGNDPGMDIIRRVWPDDNPFIHDRHQIMKTVKHELGPAGRDLAAHPRAFECAAQDADHTPLAERPRAHRHDVAHVHDEAHQELKARSHSRTTRISTSRSTYVHSSEA